MSAHRFNRAARGELDQLLRDGLLDASAHSELIRRYPVNDWDWRSLGRWFLVFGGISLAAGVLMIAGSLFAFTLETLAIVLALAACGLFAGGQALRAGGYLWTRRTLELVGGFALIGLSFTLGIIFSSGSGNWPALVLIDLLMLLPLAYLLSNILLLVLSAVLFFVWFGGVTGYLSGWGAYWFSMNYPMRFFLAGTLISLIGLLHRYLETGWNERYRGFFYVWLASGVFFAEMSLWLMSLFGSFGSIWDGWHEPGAVELAAFNLLWAGANALLLWTGLRLSLRMLRGFAVTFLIIQGYTLFFWQIAGHLGPVLSLFVAGAGSLALVGWLERWRRAN